MNGPLVAAGIAVGVGAAAGIAAKLDAEPDTDSAGSTAIGGLIDHALGNDYADYPGAERPYVEPGQVTGADAAMGIAIGAGTLGVGWAGWSVLRNGLEAVATFDGGLGSGPGGAASYRSGTAIRYAGAIGVGLLAGAGLGYGVGAIIDAARGDS